MRQIEQVTEIEQLTKTEFKELINLETVIESGLKVFYEVGEALFAIRDRRLYRSTHKTFDSYCRDRWQMSKTQANRLIGAASAASDLTPIGVIPSSESVVRPLVSLSTQQRQKAWQKAVDSGNGNPTAADVSKAVSEINEQEDSSLYSQLEEIIEDGHRLFIKRDPGSKSYFNKTNESIDWADWTWNPVTGCKHACSYCYARDIANRFYSTKFEPTFYPDRLIAPFNTKVPVNAATDIRAKNVFVCSMADLFGRWVPED